MLEKHFQLIEKLIYQLAINVAHKMEHKCKIQSILTILVSPSFQREVLHQGSVENVTQRSHTSGKHTYVHSINTLAHIHTHAVYNNLASRCFDSVKTVYGKQPDHTGSTPLTRWQSTL